MRVSEYKEVPTVSDYQFTMLLNLVEKERRQSEEAKQANLVFEAKRMLKEWGVFNAYSSKCGYKCVSSMFSQLYPRADKIVIENEIDFIEAALKELKNSPDKKKQEQYKVAELYYKGFDVVDCGCDWSERLSDSVVASQIGISERTLYRRLNSLHSFIISKKSFFNIF